jgi:hypothetical protein
MRRSDYHTLIDLARKAGLQTGDLYRSLASQRPVTLGRYLGRQDGNGFAAMVDRAGHTTFHPAARTHGV